MLTCNTLGRYGRVGNGMFQVASIIGIAKKLGYDYAFPYFRNWDHFERFGSSEDIDIQKYFKNKLPVLENPAGFREQHVEWGYRDVQLPNENISLNGHMQSEKYFAHSADLIRHYFEFDLEHQPVQPSWINDDNTVGIHVRRGDYENNYHPHTGIAFYDKAMSLFPADTKFKVFSDGMDEAKKYFGNDAEYIEGNHYMVDMYLMTQCKSFIICNSTFSWWGAWLIKNANKKIIAPSKWFGEVAGIGWQDIYADGWQVI
jgi:hypothetical protein